MLLAASCSLWVKSGQNAMQATALAGVFLERGGGTGLALAWELQLLGQKAGTGA
jgi:hypothetical protein